MAEPFAGVEGIALAHIRHLNPLPPNTEEVLRSYKRVLVPETNMGQLVKVLRAEYLIDCEPYNRVRGQPLSTEELERAMRGPSEWSFGERELFAGFVSLLNQCHF